MPPTGDYLLHIALTATRAIANKTKMQNVSTLLTILMAVAVRWYYHVHCPMEEVHGFHISH